MIIIIFSLKTTMTVYRLIMKSKNTSSVTIETVMVLIRALKNNHTNHGKYNDDK